MSKDNHEDSEQPAPEDREGPTRDEQGRWLPGHCPNPEGRPKKQPTVLLNQSDIRWFSAELIEVVVNGETVLLSRQGALLNKMYETAMKGDPAMQKFVYKEIQKNAENLAVACVRYDDLTAKWYFNNEDFRKPDYEIPTDVYLEIISLQSVLNHYFPGAYPGHEISGHDDDDDGDG